MLISSNSAMKCACVYNTIFSSVLLAISNPSATKCARLSNDKFLNQILQDLTKYFQFPEFFHFDILPELIILLIIASLPIVNVSINVTYLDLTFF